MRKSASDTCISYNINMPEPAPGGIATGQYVDEKGYIKIGVLLKIIDNVVNRDPGLRAMEVCLKILEKLEQYAVSHINIIRELLLALICYFR